MIFGLYSSFSSSMSILVLSEEVVRLLCKEIGLIMSQACLYVRQIKISLNYADSDEEYIVDHVMNGTKVKGG